MLSGKRKVSAADEIKTVTIDQDFKCALGPAAEQFVTTDPQGAAQLPAVSTHWLRHTHASQALEAGDALGHASPTTASQYVRFKERRRLTEMQLMWSRPPQARAAGKQ